MDTHKGSGETTEYQVENTDETALNTVETVNKLQNNETINKPTSCEAIEQTTEQNENMELTEISDAEEETKEHSSNINDISNSMKTT